MQDRNLPVHLLAALMGKLLSMYLDTDKYFGVTGKERGGMFSFVCLRKGLMTKGGNLTHVLLGGTSSL